MKLTYAVIFERAPNNYAAYAPDVPGCISTGKDWNEIQEMIREAIEFHIEGMIEYGEFGTRTNYVNQRCNGVPSLAR